MSSTTTHDLNDGTEVQTTTHDLKDETKGQTTEYDLKDGVKVEVSIRKGIMSFTDKYKNSCLVRIGDDIKPDDEPDAIRARLEKRWEQIEKERSGPFFYTGSDS